MFFIIHIAVQNMLFMFLLQNPCFNDSNLTKNRYENSLSKLHFLKLYHHRLAS